MSIFNLFKKINNYSKEKASLLRSEMNAENMAEAMKESQADVQPRVYDGKLYLAFKNEPIITFEGFEGDITEFVKGAQQTLAQYRYIKKLNK